MCEARAGVPQIVSPMFGDQFYWSRRVAELGLGAALPHVALNEASLTAALRQVLAAPVAERARAFAGSVGRDGARIAAARLESERGA